MPCHVYIDRKKGNGRSFKCTIYFFIAKVLKVCRILGPAACMFKDAILLEKLQKEKNS